MEEEYPLYLEHVMFSGLLDENASKKRLEVLLNCTIMAELSYDENPSHIFESGTRSSTLTEVICMDGKGDRPIVFAKDRNDFLYVGFRGTSGFRDMLTDANCIPIDTGRGGQAHKGFWKASLNVSVGLIESIAISSKCKAVILTGHSLGGAIATAVAVRMLSVNSVKFVSLFDTFSLNLPLGPDDAGTGLAVVTFGAPPLFDNGMARLLTNKYASYFHNFIGKGDPVPTSIAILFSASTQKIEGARQVLDALMNVFEVIVVGAKAVTDIVKKGVQMFTKSLKNIIRTLGKFTPTFFTIGNLYFIQQTLGGNVSHLRNWNAVKTAFKLTTQFFEEEKFLSSHWLVQYASAISADYTSDLWEKRQFQEILQIKTARRTALTSLLGNTSLATSDSCIIHLHDSLITITVTFFRLWAPFAVTSLKVDGLPESLASLKCALEIKDIEKLPYKILRKDDIVAWQYVQTIEFNPSSVSGHGSSSAILQLSNWRSKINGFAKSKSLIATTVFALDVSVPVLVTYDDIRMIVATSPVQLLNLGFTTYLLQLQKDTLQSESEVGTHPLADQQLLERVLSALGQNVRSRTRNGRVDVHHSDNDLKSCFEYVYKQVIPGVLPQPDKEQIFHDFVDLIKKTDGNILNNLEIDREWLHKIQSEYISQIAGVRRMHAHSVENDPITADEAWAKPFRDALFKCWAFMIGIILNLYAKDGYHVKGGRLTAYLDYAVADFYAATLLPSITKATYYKFPKLQPEHLRPFRKAGFHAYSQIWHDNVKEDHSTTLWIGESPISDLSYKARLDFLFDLLDEPPKTAIIAAEDEVLRLVTEAHLDPAAYDFPSALEAIDTATKSPLAHLGHLEPLFESSRDRKRLMEWIQQVALMGRLRSLLGDTFTVCMYGIVRVGKSSCLHNVFGALRGTRAIPENRTSTVTPYSFGKVVVYDMPGYNETNEFVRTLTEATISNSNAILVLLRFEDAHSHDNMAILKALATLLQSPRGVKVLILLNQVDAAFSKNQFNKEVIIRLINKQKASVLKLLENLGVPKEISSKSVIETKGGYTTTGDYMPLESIIWPSCIAFDESYQRDGVTEYVVPNNVREYLLNPRHADLLAQIMLPERIKNWVNTQIPAGLSPF